MIEEPDGDRSSVAQQSLNQLAAHFLFPGFSELNLITSEVSSRLTVPPDVFMCRLASALLLFASI